MHILSLDPAREKPVLAPADAPQIASWGRRLGAYTIDLVVYVNIAAALSYFGHPVQGWTGTVMLCVYMTLVQVCTQNTIGKYILGIQVVNDYGPAVPPSRSRMVLRETAGRLLGSIGYLLHFRDPMRQGWTDMLADTIVVCRPVTKGLRLALIGALVIVSITATALSVHRATDRQQRAAALGRMISAELAEANRIQRSIDQLRSGRGSLAQIQENNRRIPPLLDRLETSVHHLQQLLDSLEQQNLVSPERRATLPALRHVYATWLEIAAVERQQASLVVSFRPGQSVKMFQAEMLPLNARLTQLQQTFMQGMTKSAGKPQAGKFARPVS